MDKVRCWDCHKELKIELSEELKKKCPHTVDGTYFVICNECKESGNNG